MENEALSGRTAGEAVHVLGFLGRPEGDDRDILSVAALEHGGAVNAGEDSHLGADGPE